MIINKKRINNVDRILKTLGDTDKFYICVKNSQEYTDILVKKHVTDQILLNSSFVPAAVGPCTHFNADGKEIVRKDLDKKLKSFEHDYHIRDWHGQEHDGTCIQTRMCYQRDQILPPCEEMIVEEKIIRSRVLYKSEKEAVKHIINMFLEIFGVCELVDVSLQPIITKVIKRIPWKILPPGEYPWDKSKEVLKNYFSTVVSKQKITIELRHEFLSSFTPNFIAIGQDSFNDYIVYGYSKKDIYIFESNNTNNATYVFKGKWEMASKLTKKEIISGKLCYERLIHTEEWKNKISEILQSQ